MLDFMIIFAKQFEQDIFLGSVEKYLKDIGKMTNSTAADYHKEREELGTLKLKKTKRVFRIDGCTCLKDYNIEYSSQLKPVHYKLFIHDKEARMHCVTISESDVMFNLTVNRLVLFYQKKAQRRSRKAVDKKRYTSFITIGTCGVVNHSKIELNDIYFISKAIKFDRGDLIRCDADASEFLFKSEPDKLKVMGVDFPSAIGIKPMTLICSNFLYEAPNFGLTFMDTSNQEMLVDMETFDFLTICKQAQTVDYCTYKIVSDVPNPKNYIDRKHDILSAFREHSTDDIKRLTVEEMKLLDNLTESNFELEIQKPIMFYAIKKFFRKYMLHFDLKFVEEFLHHNVTLVREIQLKSEDIIPLKEQFTDLDIAENRQQQ